VVQISWTWFNPSVWETGVDVETKLLMLTTPSRRSAASGWSWRPTRATNERIMRGHMIVPDVGLRDSA
jgi:hypothetical protein